jgi:hypothetical protein
MGQWILFVNNRQHLSLVYKNLANDESFNCGELRADTPAAMVLQWVLEQEAHRPGDVITFPDGSVVQVLPTRARA